MEPCARPGRKVSSVASSTPSTGASGGPNRPKLTGTFKRVLQCQAIHDRCEHSHVVGLRLVHALASTFDASPEVATANDNCNIGTEVFACLTHFICNLREDVVVKTKASWFSERLTRKFQHYT